MTFFKILLEAHSSPLAPWTCTLHAYHIGTESPFWFPLWLTLSLRGQKQWLEWMVPQQTAPLWIQAQQFHIAGMGALVSALWLHSSCKSYNDIIVTSKSSFPHNSFKTHYNGKRWVYCKDDKWESSLCLLAHCVLTVTSLWFTGIGQIVLLYDLECHMLSASCTTKSTKQF